MISHAIQSAYTLLESSIISYQGLPVGTSASRDPQSAVPEQYSQCFLRDFFPAALVFLNDGKPEIVENFLKIVCELRCHQQATAGHTLVPGVMPASFQIVRDEKDNETPVGDFGERAIGRVAPVDSVMWWTLLMDALVRRTGHREFVEQKHFQDSLNLNLDLFLKEGFEVYPTLLVPDASFMIDRRLGVHGHPLEVQSLFYGLLQSGLRLLVPTAENRELLEIARRRLQAMRTYIRIFYWLDLPRLNEIHRFDTEEFGTGSVNMLNIYPESIPDWIYDWIPEDGGYLVGNLGPGRMDFRFFAQGNLLAILFDLATPDQAGQIMDLYESRWEHLVGTMPVKICYPALEGTSWNLLTGCDPKNGPWSYHNGGNWPVILWPFVAAALKTGRRELAQRAFEIACQRLPKEEWPEYYDGRSGRLIDRRANMKQIWSASALILSHQLLEDPARLSLFTGEDPPSPS